MQRPTRLGPPPGGFAFYDIGRSPVIVPAALAAQLASERARRREGGNNANPFADVDDRPRPAAAKAAPARVPAPKPRRDQVPIFDAAAVEEALACVEEQGASDQARLLPALKQAARDGGLRRVRRPTGRALTRIVAALREDFPNFGAVFDVLAPDWALQAARGVADFRPLPVLLYGSPGIGKTYFASSLAKRLGVDWEVISAGGSQGAFELVGTSKNWSNAAPGRVFRLLARSAFASSILLIDEVDKLGQERQFPVTPALLDLLEEQSARQFRDTALDVVCDASRLLVILTANDVEQVPAPLRSRVQEVAVATPTPSERLAITRRLADELSRSLRAAARVTIDPSWLEALACAPIDLREVRRRLRRAVGLAMLAGRKRVVLSDGGVVDKSPAQVRMGFV